MTKHTNAFESPAYSHWKRKYLSETSQGIIISFLPLYFSLTPFLHGEGGGQEKTRRLQSALTLSNVLAPCVACQLVSLMLFKITGRTKHNKSQIIPLAFSSLLASQTPWSPVLWSLQTEQSTGFLEKSRTFHEKFISSVILLAFFFSSSIQPQHNERVIC